MKVSSHLGQNNLAPSGCAEDQKEEVTSGRGSSPASYNVLADSRWSGMAEIRASGRWMHALEVKSLSSYNVHETKCH